MRIIIVGGGRVGGKLGKLFVKEKHDVIIIEKNPDVAKELSSELDALVLNGDATEGKILIQAGIKEADCLIAATSDDKVNLLVVGKAKKFGIGKVISRVCDPENYESFLKLEAIPIDETGRIVEAIHNAISAPEKEIVLSIAGGRGYIVRVLVKETSPCLGKKIGKVNLKKNIICIERNKELIPLHEDDVFLEGDIVFLLAKPEELKEMIKTFG